MNQLRKYIRKVLKESIEEAYPESFNMETFKSLRNHAERNRYAAEHLQKIAAGSSRVVYKIDDEKVLKLAKNNKGIAQNGTEISWGNDSYFGDILAKTFDYDDNDLWVEMELARKINKYEFKRLTGFNIEDVNTYLRIFEAENNGRTAWWSIDPELKSKMNEDEFIAKILDFSQSADIEVGDFGRASSYGVVKRDGHEVLVITDYGLTKDVYQTHYEKPKRFASMYENETIDEAHQREEEWKKEIAQVAKQLKVSLTNFLGAGVWGIAYEIPGNRVLKITEDDREVDNAKHLIGQKNKFMADIYNVYSIGKKKEKESSPFQFSAGKRVIVMEKLIPLEKDNQMLGKVIKFSDAFDEYSSEESSWTEMLENGWDEDFDNFLRKKNKGLEDVYSDLLAIYEEAASKGIYLSDMHQENFGIKNGHLAIFDIT